MLRPQYPSQKICPPSHSINDLPQEIISKIFEHVLSPASYHHIFSLMTVCRDWRCYALGQPKFWSNIVVDLRNPLDREATSQLSRLVHTFLARSSKHALTLSLNLPFDTVECRNFLTSLMVEEHCDRWRHVQLSMPLQMVGELFKKTDKLPLLRSLDVRIEDDFHLPRDVYINITHAHALLHLCIILPFEIVPTTCFRLPRGLRSCSCIWGSGKEILDFMRHRSNTLTDLSLFYSDAIFISTLLGDGHDFYVYSPTLRTLRINVGEPPVDFTSLLSNLSVPSLKSLAVHDMETPFLAPQMDAFIAFLIRHPSLANLSFQDSALTNDALKRCFEVLPNLSCLTVVGPPRFDLYWSEDLYKALANCGTLQSLLLECRCTADRMSLPSPNTCSNVLLSPAVNSIVKVTMPRSRLQGPHIVSL